MPHADRITTAEIEPYSVTEYTTSDRLRSGGSAGRCACPGRADSGGLLGPTSGGLNALRLAGPLAVGPSLLGAGCGPLASAGRCGLKAAHLRRAAPGQWENSTADRPQIDGLRLAPAVARHLSSPNSFPHADNFAYSPTISHTFCGTCLPTVLSNGYVDTLFPCVASGSCRL